MPKLWVIYLSIIIIMLLIQTETIWIQMRMVMIILIIKLKAVYLLVDTIHIWLPTIVTRDMTSLTNSTYKWIQFSQMDQSLITNGFWIILIVTPITTFIQSSTILTFLSNTQIHNHIDRVYKMRSYSMCYWLRRCSE